MMAPGLMKECLERANSLNFFRYEDDISRLKIPRSFESFGNIRSNGDTSSVSRQASSHRARLVIWSRLTPTASSDQNWLPWGT